MKTILLGLILFLNASCQEKCPPEMVSQIYELYDSEEFEKAKAQISTCNNDSYHFNLLRGRIYSKLNEFDQAEEYLKKAISLNNSASSNSACYLELFYLYNEGGYYNKANSLIDSILLYQDLRPNDVWKSYLIFLQAKFKSDFELVHSEADYILKRTRKNQVKGIDRNMLKEVKMRAFLMQGDTLAACNYAREIILSDESDKDKRTILRPFPKNLCE